MTDPGEPRRDEHLSDFYLSTIVKVEVSFQFFRGGCNPDEISGALELKPV